MVSSTETSEYYSGEGTYFGSGTNTGARSPTSEILQRVRILRYLESKKGRKLNAIALGHIKKVKSNNTYKLTSIGWQYWKDVKEANKEIL